jgi:hypothetical protein
MCRPDQGIPSRSHSSRQAVPLLKLHIQSDHLQRTSALCLWVVVLQQFGCALTMLWSGYGVARLNGAPFRAL